MLPTLPRPRPIRGAAGRATAGLRRPRAPVLETHAFASLRRTALAGALVATRAHAQELRRVNVVGWLSSDPEPDLFLEGFREGMRRYGYVEGQNLAIISRFGTGDPSSLVAKVEEVRQAKPALIVARGGLPSGLFAPNVASPF